MRLKQLRPSEVSGIWRDLLSRGKGWKQRAQQGLDALERLFPELNAGNWLKL